MKTLKPKLATANLAVAQLPPKVADAYYHSTDWKTLRQAVFRRDGYACSVPGCERPVFTADHIVSRRAGGKDEMSNLRSLCATHDNQVKEGPDGTRRSGGRFK